MKLQKGSNSRGRGSLHFFPFPHPKRLLKVREQVNSSNAGLLVSAVLFVYPRERGAWRAHSVEG